jgi:hypothetical protein
MTKFLLLVSKVSRRDIFFDRMDLALHQRADVRVVVTEIVVMYWGGSGKIHQWLVCMLLQVPMPIVVPYQLVVLSATRPIVGILALRKMGIHHHLVLLLRLCHHVWLLRYWVPACVLHHLQSAAASIAIQGYHPSTAASSPIRCCTSSVSFLF